MPTSWIEAIPDIFEEIYRLNPDSILDIGVGFGKYGVLLRERLEVPFERYSKKDWKIRIDGIEAFKDYRNPIHDHVYDNVYYDTIENRIDYLPTYDIILMIDVLEHFEKEKGKEIVKKLLSHTKKGLIISTPLYPAEQGDYLGNHYEEHKSRWMQLDFIEHDFFFKLLPLSKNGAQIFVIYPTEHCKKEFPFDSISIEPVKEKKPLTISYFLPHKNLTGGVKMLLEQMKHLRKNGHKIHAYSKGNTGDSVLPEWFDIEADKEILVPHGESFLSRLKDCDVGVIGWMEQLKEFSTSPIPLVYLEQGSEYLFGEYPESTYRIPIANFYQYPVAIASVSPTVSRILSARYGRNAPVIPNGVDTNFYHPGKRANENVILLVGNPNLMFKGFDIALKVLARLWQMNQKFKVKWVCQAEPSIAKFPLPFATEYIVMPSQEKLAECYREADVFLFTSWYEGFGMPPLEAMASGVPVVSTRCGGIEVYAEDNVNALLAEPGDFEELAKAVAVLLNSEKARDALAKAGRRTALNFSFSSTIPQLENYLFQLVTNSTKAGI